MLINTRFSSQNTGFMPTSVVKIIAIFWLLISHQSTFISKSVSLQEKIQYNMYRDIEAEE
jgi:hypothetical protein